MVFGGIQKNSFIDFPGKTCCVLFLSGCNFQCPYCHNPGLVRADPAAPPLAEEGVYDFLEKRRGLLDGVVVSGGEPTLNKDLEGLCERLKNLGYPVKLDTNGSRPNRLRQLIQKGLVDYIAMDVKTDPAHYHGLGGETLNPDLILASIRIILESGIPHEFRTTCIRGLITAEAVEEISRQISGADLYALQQFRPTDALRPDYFSGADLSFSQEDLLYFKSLAEPKVRKCIVR